MPTGAGAVPPSRPSWLDEPWAGALMRFVADAASDLDAAADGAAAVPGWPRGIPIAAALRDPRSRGRLGRWLLPGPAADAAATAACASPRARLALVPAEDAARLMATAAAWLNAPRLAALIRRADVEAARAALGDAAFAFALRNAALMPRPPDVLLAALGGSDVEAVDPRQGAALYGLAMGVLPEPMLDRLRLRRPDALWQEAVRRASAAGADEAAGRAAFAAVRRLAREAATPWSSWLN